ncbi:gluconokinase [Candidatus Puniceispirillum sp.]|jgi:gluconokinase|uniref:gluconokinase n=1 Tax=Candidatus Puniceispirillum sp. TaxID=2026719 RepID=UPI001EB355FF|nr:gluconokinase [Candidatus Puniceispirillum sp.]MBT6566506.1 gluconokinase [Candidatus Puniceispirillum sp.]
MGLAPVRLFVLMGITGSGKSSYGAILADRKKATYIEGDDFHPPANIANMSAGMPLSDDDRWTWLKVVAAQMTIPTGVVFVGCSALRKCYREYLTNTAGMPVHFIYLDADRPMIVKRMTARDNHFMPISLIDSQFDVLEVPDDKESASHIDISGSKDAVITRILAAIDPLI